MKKVNYIILMTVLLFSVSADAEESGPGSEPADEIQVDEMQAGEEPVDLSIYGWISLSTGGALLLSGAVTGGVAMSVDNDLADECENGKCSPESQEKVDKLDTLSLATNILIGVGAAFAATGVTLLIVDSMGDQSDDGIALTPVLGEVSGIALTGSF